MNFTKNKYNTEIVKVISMLETNTEALMTKANLDCRGVEARA